MADVDGGSSVFRHQYSPLTEVFLKRKGKDRTENGGKSRLDPQTFRLPYLRFGLV
jgi:hypothetical protein